MSSLFLIAKQTNTLINRNFSNIDTLKIKVCNGKLDISPVIKALTGMRNRKNDKQATSLSIFILFNLYPSKRINKTPKQRRISVNETGPTLGIKGSFSNIIEKTKAER